MLGGSARERSQARHQPFRSCILGAIRYSRSLQLCWLRTNLAPNGKDQRLVRIFRRFITAASRVMPSLSALPMLSDISLASFSHTFIVGSHLNNYPQLLLLLSSIETAAGARKSRVRRNLSFLNANSVHPEATADLYACDPEAASDPFAAARRKLTMVHELIMVLPWPLFPRAR